MATIIDFVALMLSRRGYACTSIEKCTSSLNTATTYIIDKCVFVTIIMNVKITNDIIKNILGMAKQSKVIIVHAKQLTSEARATVLHTNVLDIETFTCDTMSYDLIAVVPAHSKLVGPPPNEWQRFPVLSVSDPVARYYGYKKNDIVRIIDDDDTVTMRRVA